MSFLRVFGNSRAFQETELKLLSKANVIDFVKCGDYCHKSDFVANMASTVFVRDCDKNYVFYNIDTNRLPKLETLYLDSHPCEFSVVSRLWKNGIKVKYVYNHVWLNEATKISPHLFTHITDKEMKDKILELENGHERFCIE
jgi:hypothetical protein